MSQPTIRCEVCGKVIVPTSDTAGQTMRCDCGHMISVPDSPSGPAQTYEFVEEWNPDPNAKKKKAPAARPAPAPATEEAPTFSSAKKDTVTGRYGPRKKVDRRRAGDADREVLRVMHDTTGRWLMTFAVVGAVILGAIVWKFRQESIAPPPTTMPVLRADDQAVVDEMRESGSTEAIEWLKAGKRHAVLGWSNEQALGRVKTWYNLGAVKVLAFGEGIAGSLVIELPADPKKRAALFAWQNDYANDTHQKPVADTGQKYLIIELKF
jgi:hypothetical protein